MTEFMSDLIKWLKEQQESEKERADRYSCFDDINRSDAYIYCSDCYKYTLNKIEELKKKYNIK